MTNFKTKLSARRGFTLIELLIVIAILGVLAVVVLIALNPVQQLARTRDAGRIAAVTQLGHAMEAYATSNNSLYPTENATWITSLQTAGEISTVPTNTAPTAPAATGKATPAVCSGAGLGIQGNFCYNTSNGTTGGPIIVYSALESAANNTRCAGTTVAFAVYSSADGRGGIVCAASYATVLTAGNQTFLP